MTDYVQITDFSAKDALSTSDPEKIVLGADVDAELGAISTAITSKYDVSDLASQAEAEAEGLNTKLMTPLRLANWADYNAGMVGDIQALSDPGADRLLGWDDSAGAAIAFTVTTGLSIAGTSVLIDTAVVPQLGSNNNFTQTVNGNNIQTVTNSSTGASAITGLNLTNSANTLFLRILSTGFSGTHMSGQSSGEAAMLATTSTLQLGFGTNSICRFNINGSGDFDFRGGTVTTNNASASEVGMKGAPQNSQADNYTLVLTDAGKHIYQSGSGKTITIPANASVAFPVGTVVLFYTHNAACTIAITSDTLIFAGTGGTGSRTLATGGLASALKIASTTWVISGMGLT